MSDDRVLIAGAGPVGMITGYCLARAGVPVTLFDSLAEIPDYHRAATLQPSTLDLLDGYGMTEKLLPQGLRSPLFQFRDRAEDRLVAEFDYGLLKDDTDFPFALQIEQHKTVGVVHGMAEPLPDFELFREHTVTGASQSADGVEIIVETKDGRTMRHRGRFLVGWAAAGIAR